MILRAGIKEESYKLKWGIDNAQSDSECFTSSTVKLVTGKRDWAAFQILVKADEDFTVSLGNNPLFSPYGPLKNIRFNLVFEANPGIRVNMNPIFMVEDDDRVYKADMILNSDSITVKKDFVQAIWVEATVSENIASGIYKGQVFVYQHAMFEDERVVGCMNVQLEVVDAPLPEPKNFKFHLDLWQHLSNIARKHEVVLWSDEHFDVIEKYVQSLAGLGQKAVTIIASEIPWSGQGCFKVAGYPSDLFEYSMVRIERDQDGTLFYDFSVIERYINLCFKYGIDREIEVFGLTGIWLYEDYGYGPVSKDYPDAIRLRYLDHADGRYKYVKRGEEIKDYIKVLEQFFTDKGWIGKVRIVADEPSDVELYRERINLIGSIAPTFKFKTAINHVEFIEEFKDRVTDFVPVLPGVCEKWDMIKGMKKEIEGKLLWYVCCWPEIPNTFIRSNLLESQFIGILTAYLKLDGFLRWNYTVWPENPREKISYRFPGWSAGDTNFVYPGNNGSPMLTLRYKALKRGIELFELIEMLRARHQTPDKVLEEVWGRILKTGDIQDFNPSKGKKIEELISLDYSNYAYVRELLLEEISGIN